MGANLGDPAVTLRRAAGELSAFGTVTRRSRLWRTDPVGGPPGQPDYLNAVIALRPAAPYADVTTLLEAFHGVEARHGRVRRERWAPRTLDLDLLAYGSLVRDAPDPVVPHPRMMTRAFVLVPLLEVDPEWRHPRTGVAAADALAALDRSGLRPADVSWVPR
ncbi:MAG: 2-amino-4-hydroxy-6-hydroxymethyldihydropteridine diphosphokinase [Trueperaceae bacterium]|nr:2-amino-4-hydroxy-6-hydroxymethyldihydropteridine diphosphokinase [Trueperaceae bacterium]